MSSEKKKWKSLAIGTLEIPPIYEFADKPLEAALWCLYVSKNDLGNDYLLQGDIEYVLQEFLDIPIDAISIVRAFARAGKRVIQAPAGTGYKISRLGEEYLRGLKKNEPLNVVYINPNKPRTAKKNLESLIASIPKDELLICDPYYGLRTLEVLEAIAKHHRSIKFLTAKAGGGENKATLPNAIADFQKEYKGKIELRLASGADLHDRYILAKSQFLIVGHGIKDLGNKESLIVVVEDRYGKDIRKTIAKNFHTRWALGKPL